jgi:hypothetical protein
MPEAEKINGKEILCITVDVVQYMNGTAEHVKHK